MGIRHITGNLAADPEVVAAGKTKITKFRVLENTAEYRGGERVKHLAPITHFVEAKFQLGENVAATLHAGDAVIVVGSENDSSYDNGGELITGRRVIVASHIGPDLSHAVAQIRRVTVEDDGA